ncbi:MAG: Asp23/Gls24 family envelope stress response protein, partial [Acidimicrobiales bacterium]
MSETQPVTTEVEVGTSELDTPRVTPRTAGGPLDRRAPGARLRTDRGVTQIAEVVVSKIAAIATREIPGVHAMGKGLARAFGSLRSRVPGGTATDTTTQGIMVEVGERQAAIDIDIVAY